MSKTICRTLSAVCAAAILWGCGGGGGADEPPVVAPPPPPPPIVSATVTGQAKYLEDAAPFSVTLESASGGVLGTADSDETGAFSIQVDDERSLDGGFMLKAENATYPNMVLLAEGDPTDRVINISIVSTLVDGLALEGLSGSDGVLAELQAIGLLGSEDTPQTLETERVILPEFQSEVERAGSSEAFLAELSDDLADRQTDAEFLGVFPFANGGVLSVLDAISDRESFMQGGVYPVAVAASTTIPDLETHFELTEPLDWVAVDADTDEVILDIPDDMTGEITVSLEAKTSLSEVGRAFDLTFFVQPRIELLSGTLGPSGGRLATPWEDVVITADAGDLSADYEFSYFIAASVDGEVLTSLDINPDITQSEAEKVTVLVPPATALQANYLRGSSSDGAEKAPRYDSIKKSITTVFRSGVPNDCRETWIDANGDGSGFGYVWSGRLGKFAYRTRNGIFRLVGLDLSALNGEPRVAIDYVNEPSTAEDNIKWSFVYECASRLSSLRSWSSISPNGGAEAVIFVHGFVFDGSLGGNGKSIRVFRDSTAFNMKDTEYFGSFPRLLSDQGYIPFLFEWRTNASFNDVAAELALAVDEVAKSTGKKVHIIAHSYGGLVARTLLQSQSSYSGFDANFVESRIATLTTIGTPHGGVSFKTQNLTGEGGDIAFPEGRSFTWKGLAIEACRAITCHEAGERYSIAEDWPIFGAQGRFGDVVYDLRNEIANYPDIPTLSLMGVVPKNIACDKDGGDCAYRFDFDRDASDGLITLRGQRFKPELSFGALMNGNAVPGGVNEVILDFTIDDKVVVPARGDAILAHIAGRAGQPFFGGSPTAKVFGAFYHFGASFAPGGVDVDGELTDRLRGLDQLTEAALEYCRDETPENCAHPTWLYVTKHLAEHPAQVTTAGLEEMDIIVFVDEQGGAPRVGYKLRVLSEDVVIEEVEVSAGTTETRLRTLFVPNSRYSVEVIPLSEGARYARSISVGYGSVLPRDVQTFSVSLVPDEESPELVNVLITASDGDSGRALADFDVSVFNEYGNFVSRTVSRAGVASLRLLPGNFTAVVESADIAEPIAFACAVTATNGGMASCEAQVDIVAAPPPVDTGLFVYDELDDGVMKAEGVGLVFVDSPDGRAAELSRARESRIEYAFADGFPREGTVEIKLNVANAYYYSNYALQDDEDCALIFTTDIHQGDVARPGSAWLYTCKDGRIISFIGENTNERPSSRPDLRLEAQSSSFRFDQWHTVSLSYGSEGRSMAVDGVVVAENAAQTQPLGDGSASAEFLGPPTIGESVSQAWQNNQYEGGFEGLVESIRVTASQKSFVLSAR